jgi:putative ABC transport system permease protein
MFKARTSRTFLTILGMSVGIGAILFLVSLGYGLQKTILKKITTSDSLLSLDVSPNKSSQAILDSNSLQKIEKIPGVVKISPSYQLNAQGQMDNLTVELSATVVDSLYLKLAGIKLTDGKLINDQEPNGIIISSSVAKIFNKNDHDIIGKLMSFNFSLSKDMVRNYSNDSQKYIPQNKFKIIGVTAGDSNAVYINTKALNMIQVAKFNHIKIKCQNNKIMPSIQKSITDKGYLVSSLSSTVDQANKVFRIVKIILMLFGFIALVVSAIGMFNTMTITLLERTEEIGIMKSIGASDGMISLIFVMEATIMGFLGGVVGVIIGFLEGWLFNFIVNSIASHLGGEKVSLFYSPLWFVLSILIFSLVVGFLTGVIPARRASRIDPLDALRYK